jgi:hypothetical protein
VASLPPVSLPANQWVDLYASTGIAVGTQIIIQNTGKDVALLSDSLAEPLPGAGYNKIVVNGFLTSVATPDGAWALSSRGTKLQVEEA